MNKFEVGERVRLCVDGTERICIILAIDFCVDDILEYLVSIEGNVRNQWVLEAFLSTIPPAPIEPTWDE